MILLKYARDFVDVTGPQWNKTPGGDYWKEVTPLGEAWIKDHPGEARLLEIIRLTAHTVDAERDRLEEVCPGDDLDGLCPPDTAILDYLGVPEDSADMEDEEAFCRDNAYEAWFICCSHPEVSSLATFVGMCLDLKVLFPAITKPQDGGKP